MAPFLRLIILGAAAGGGVPQWNCGCRNCVAARSGAIPRMTQSSVAVSADGAAWVLLNASPDLGAQLAATPALHPRAPRDTPIAAVMLTNADVDHVAGLLTLREKQAFTLAATRGVLDVLAANSIFGVLDPALVTRRALALEASATLAPGLSATLFAVPGKVALYLEGATVETRLEGEQTVGVALKVHGRNAGGGRADGGDAGGASSGFDGASSGGASSNAAPGGASSGGAGPGDAPGGATAFYIPGCAAMTPALADRLRGADLVLFDGTVWSDDEMIAGGLGAKSGARMGHMAMSGPEGAIAAFEGLDVKRKIFVHVNNSNPALDPHGPERVALEAAGWTIGHDGMEVTL